MASPIRIAFFADILVRDFDGAARTMYHIIDRKPAEVEMRYYCGVPPTEDGYDVVTTETFRAPGNETYSISLPWRNKAKLTASLADFSPDVIHIASPSLLGNFAAAYANEHAIPVSTIYHTHFISYIEYYLRRVPYMVGMAERVVRGLYRRFYDRCQCILVPTRAMERELADIGIDPAKMVIWERGIDTTIFHPDVGDLDYLRSFTGNDRPTLLFASRLVWEKNVETLIRLSALILERNLDYNLLIVGSGVAKDEMQRRMPHAVFAGEVSQESLAKLYGAADVFVFTSISETFGNVVTEAMASGCPCVIANGGGTTAHIETGVSGYIVPPNDVAAYLDRAYQLITDIGLRASIRGKALEYTSALSWQQLASRFFSTLQGLTSTKAA